MYRASATRLSSNNYLFIYIFSIIHLFTSGKFLVENRAGYVIAAVPANLEFTETEQEKFKDYDLYATEEDLISIEGYQLFMQGTQNNHRSKAYH